MPKDILKPLPTHSINPLINMRKNDFIRINYINVRKKICLFFKLNIYYTPSWVILKNIVADVKSVLENVAPNEEQKRNNYIHF